MLPRDNHTLEVRRRHTSRFLVIYITFMPFTLWHACGWGSVPASVVIAFLLLGIEEIGVQIEEPFGILPLGALFRSSIREGCCTVGHGVCACRYCVAATGWRRQSLEAATCLSSVCTAGNSAPDHLAER